MRNERRGSQAERPRIKRRIRLSVEASSRIGAPIPEIFRRIRTTASIPRHSIFCVPIDTSRNTAAGCTAVAPHTRAIAMTLPQQSGLVHPFIFTPLANTPHLEYGLNKGLLFPAIDLSIPFNASGVPSSVQGIACMVFQSNAHPCGLILLRFASRGRPSPQCPTRPLLVEATSGVERLHVVCAPPYSSPIKGYYMHHFTDCESCPTLSPVLSEDHGSGRRLRRFDWGYRSGASIAPPACEKHGVIVSRTAYEVKRAAAGSFTRCIPNSHLSVHARTANANAAPGRITGIYPGAERRNRRPHRRLTA